MTRNHDEIRTKIVDGASIFFSRYGLYKTTIDDISRSLHMGKSSLYYYFENKEKIFEAVIKKELAVLGARIKDAVDRASEPQEKLKVYAVTRMTCLRELTNVYSALRDEYLNPCGFVQEIRKDYDNRELDLVTKILRDGIERKIFAIKKKDVALTAKVIILALRGFEFEWGIRGQAVNVDENIAMLHNVLLNGIMKK